MSAEGAGMDNLKNNIRDIIEIRNCYFGACFLLAEGPSSVSLKCFIDFASSG